MGAKLRVIRRRMRSVNSTMKITRAMELIAASRIVKAQGRVESSRPYAERLTAALEDVARQRGSPPGGRGGRRAPDGIARAPAPGGASGPPCRGRPRDHLRPRARRGVQL